ncbi:hypothetical protein MP228_000214 [Amoeboaphelidium protococcarum]|nr:hypothetical protein MP228_000214 [Amoeboaphelidium protococcarum]
MKRQQQHKRDNVSQNNEQKRRHIDQYFGSANKTAQEDKMIIKWIDDGPPTLLHGQCVFKDSSSRPLLIDGKIACFDLDGTLITTKGSHTFPKSEFDWKWLHPKITLSKVRECHEQGYSIIIISNQLNLFTQRRDGQWKRKLEAICQQLEVPLTIFAAGADDQFRKPNIGIFRYIQELRGRQPPALEDGEIHSGLSYMTNVIDMEQSFYVGDAAGRSHAGTNRKADHSDADYHFAKRSGLKFYTPEEYFLGEQLTSAIYKDLDTNGSQQSQPDSKVPLFDPLNIKNADTPPLFEPTCSPLLPLDQNQQEMIMLVGFPGCGKSTFCVTYLKDYARVNQDSLGSGQKCIDIAKQLLTQGKRVVIDNTNPSKHVRQQYIRLAKDCGVPVRCFKFNVSELHCKHNNQFRKIIGERQSVPNSAYEQYRLNYEQPDLQEGFTEIKVINFVPRFKDDIAEQNYYKILL